MPFETREPFLLENEKLKLFGVLHLPSAVTKAPVVLICHGLGGNKVGRHRLFVHLSEDLSKAGIASVRFDFRGSGDSEGEFADISLRSQVSDTVKVLSMVEEHPALDKARIGVLGKSLGGVIGVLTASETHLIRSIALWASPYHAKPWAEGVMKGNSSGSIETQLEFNGMVLHAPFLKEFFTLQLNESLSQLESIPLLSIHGEKDEVVDISHRDYYMKGRDQASAQTKSLTLSESDHDFGCIKEQRELLDTTFNWFKDTL